MERQITGFHQGASTQRAAVAVSESGSTVSNMTAENRPTDHANSNYSSIGDRIV